MRQSGLPSQPVGVTKGSQTGTLLRGVVLKTYLPSDPDHPFSLQGRQVPNMVLCDVLPYGSLVTPHILRTVPVAQRCGRSDCTQLWIPRPTRYVAPGGSARLSGGTYAEILRGVESGQLDPTAFDGDHVLIMYVEGIPMQPVIIAGLHHYHSDIDLPTFRFGKHSPVFYARNRGSEIKIDDEGNVGIDASAASDGTYQDDGGEVAGSGSGGSLTLRCRNDKEIRLFGAGGAVADRKVARVDDTVRSQYGGAMSTFLQEVATALDSLVGPPGHFTSLYNAAINEDVAGVITSGHDSIKTD